jgi:hypothetical protein
MLCEVIGIEEEISQATGVSIARGSGPELPVRIAKIYPSKSKNIRISLQLSLDERGALLRIHSQLRF